MTFVQLDKHEDLAFKVADDSDLVCEWAEDTTVEQYIEKNPEVLKDHVGIWRTPETVSFYHRDRLKILSLSDLNNRFSMEKWKAEYKRGKKE